MVGPWKGCASASTYDSSKENSGTILWYKMGTPYNDSLKGQRVIQSKRTKNLCRQTQALLIPPNKICTSWQWKESSECHNLSSGV